MILRARPHARRRDGAPGATDESQPAGGGTGTVDWETAGLMSMASVLAGSSSWQVTLQIVQIGSTSCMAALEAEDRRHADCSISGAL